MHILSDFPDSVVAILTFVFGLLIGSFLNVVIFRLPREESIVFPGSHCPSCNTAIKPYDNIPVFSYLLLRGKCRNCGVRISPIYPAIELLTALLYLALFLFYGRTAIFLANVVFVTFIIPLVFIDLYHKLLLNAITYPGFVVAVALRVLVPDTGQIESTRALLHLWALPTWTVALISALIGALVGGGILWLIRELYFRFRHIEGMGMGDIKMMFMVGAFLGWELAILTIFAASLGGSLVGLIIAAVKRQGLKIEIPFGVFLGPAAVLALLFGQTLINWYVGLLH